MIRLFLPPLLQVFTLEQVTTGIVRKSAHGRSTQEDRGIIRLGHVRVRTPGAYVASKCFIHCAMPLGQLESQDDDRKGCSVT